MVPFMVGMGLFQGRRFSCRAVLHTGLDEELRCSRAGKNAGTVSLVVTYNGATFDIPLLESRFILARLENPLLECRTWIY
jgi:uncharacterized protein YprB with RNaseH-like and TPR domain